MLAEGQTKAKVKFDRQIVAIALANGAHTVYTGDEKLAARAVAAKLKAVLTWNLPLPPEPPQASFAYDDKAW